MNDPTTKTNKQSEHNSRRMIRAKKKRLRMQLFIWMIALSLLLTISIVSIDQYQKKFDYTSVETNQILSSTNEDRDDTPSDISESSPDKHVEIPLLVNQPEPEQEDWALTLVNPWNSMPEKFSVSLTTLKNGHAVDKRIYPALQEMMDDCRAAGLAPLICSSYRTQEKQTQLYDKQVSNYKAQGYTTQEAKTEAARWVAVPGTSEHQLGLAVDIVAASHQALDASQETTDVQQWLMNNSYKYGFILRYPSDKSEITGIGFEPWHYRYVGKEVAAKITEEGICLEEYLESKNKA